MMNPLVSIIIPTYNRQILAERAVISVLSQTYKNIECIVVDDCSTDDTVAQLNELTLKDNRLSVISHTNNRHVSAARNTGLAAANGELIAFLDDDDAWLPNKLDKQVACILSLPDTFGLVYCWFDMYSGNNIVGTRRPKLRGDVFNNLLLSQPLGNASTLLVRKAVVDHIGGFDENLLRGNDGDFIRRITEHYHVDVVPEVLVHYFVDHGGHPRITGNDRKSLINGLISQEVKLIKFEKSLSERPKIKAELLSLIALNNARVGYSKAAIKNLFKAIQITPFYFKVYKFLIKVVYYLILRKSVK